MAKRFTDTRLTRERWYRVLSPLLKCGVRFLFDECDNAGVWEVDEDAMCFFIGDKISLGDLIHAINSDGKERLRFIREGKLFIVDFVEFQFGALRDSNPVHLSVIKLLRKHGMEPEVVSGPSDRPSAVLSRLSAKKKIEIFTSDSLACSYCRTPGTPETLRVDHIIPRTHGGGNEDSNLTTACIPCNSKKSDLDAADFIKRHSLESTISPSLRSKLDLIRPNKGLNSPKEEEEEKNKGKGQGSLQGSAEGGNAPPLIPLPREQIETCVEEWQRTLDRYGIRKKAKNEELTIARLIQRFGFELILQSLAGFRFEEKTKDFNPAKNVFLHRLEKPGNRERLSALGAQNQDRPRELVEVPC